MPEPFFGTLDFYQVDEDVNRTAKEVLEHRKWDVNHYNAPYLAGLRSWTKPGEKVELTDAQAFKGAPCAKLPAEWSEENTLAVVGDITHELRKGTSFILARTDDFMQAGEIAEKLDYRPALAGEFIQLMDWLAKQGSQKIGWFYCYEGRKAGYAILADYNGYSDPPLARFIFDTHIGSQVEDGYISSNADNYCFFVLK